VLGQTLLGQAGHLHADGCMMLANCTDAPCLAAMCAVSFVAMQVSIYKAQASALARHASPGVKVVVVANPGERSTADHA
jgi:hypothetical protein